MAENQFKISQKEKGSVFSQWENLVNTDRIFSEGVPLKYLPHLLFSAFLCIFYIGNSHYAETKIRKISRLRVEVQDLRADYATLKADYMLASKQSEVAKRVEALGLYESMQPPNKIEITKGEY